MKPFLKLLADFSISEYGIKKLSGFCYVFPNRRSGLFFKHYLMQQVSDSTFWLPEVLTISELFSNFSKLDKADPMDISFELYSIYNKLVKSKESYEDFYHWGEMMISDFDDIDKYLIPAQKLFTNIVDLREIDSVFSEMDQEQQEVIREFWRHFQKADPSEEQKKFLDSWRILYPAYETLRESLLQSGTGYEGMLYRQVADRIENNDLADINWDKIIFAGFNALSTSEKVLFRYFKNTGQALFFWDYDDEYLSDANAEAGRFLRKNLEEFPAAAQIFSSENLKNPKNIQIIELSSDILQARNLGKLLSERDADNPMDFDDTAVVLGDENLLEPVISSIPDDIPYVNITMGYPLTHTNACGFTLQLLELQKNLSRQSFKVRGEFYFRDVLSILNHQYLHYFMHEDLHELIRRIQSFNMIYISPDFFADLPLLRKIFIKVEDSTGISEYLRDILTYMFSRIQSLIESETDLQLEREYLLNILSRVNKLEKIFEKYISLYPALFSVKTEFVDKPDEISGHEMNEIHDIPEMVQGTRGDGGIGIYARILRKILRNTRIPFEGEPLQGLQIMGILETRLLDFKNVIFLSMNEGIMPRSHSSTSFIPLNLKYAFGMPVREDHDAIYAYYFYRLLQRAENISLMYNNKADGLKSGEKSRYLYQLEYMRERKVAKKTVAFQISSSVYKDITIDRNEDIEKKLNEFGERGNRALSPTALTAWLECPFRFYMAYIAGIRQQDEISEKVDAPLLGSILHHAMREIYNNYQGKLINNELFKLIKNEEYINSCINNAFLKEFNRLEETEGLEFIPEGRNIIVYEVIKKLIKNILEFDSMQLPFTILGLEKKYQMLVSAGSRKVRLSGFVDRIDQKDGVVRLIDYKTGSVNQTFPSLKSLFDKEARERFKEIFQVFTYSYLYMAATTGRNIIVPSIYAVRNLRKSDYSPYLVIKDNSDRAKTDIVIDDFSKYLKDFEAELKDILTEIFDSSVSFKQTDDLKRCVYCPYNRICHRDQTEAEF